jgi:hypothetical protein
LNQAEGTFPAGCFASSGSRQFRINPAGKKKGKNRESIDAVQNNSTTSHHTHAAVLRAFAKSGGVVPPPDGGYPGGNTAEGQAALLSLTTGGFNTAVGFLSLRSNTTGSFNTATGAGRSLPILQTQIRPLAPGHFSAIRPAPTIRPMERLLYLAIQKVPLILPPEIKLFSLIRLALPTARSA